MNLKEIVIVLLILCLGLGMRLYNLSERTSFDADQEWLATRAYEISKGDFPLLGPVTSVGNFSIGPGYVYLTAFIGLFTENAPITGAYLSVILGVATLTFIYLFTKHFIDNKVAYIILFLTSISRLIKVRYPTLSKKDIKYGSESDNKNYFSLGII